MWREPDLNRRPLGYVQHIYVSKTRYDRYVNSKAKGEISEGVVIGHLLKLGYSVAIPFGDNQRYDLIVDEDGDLVRAQVKTGRLHNGCVMFGACSVNGFTGKRTPYTGQIEVFLVYCPPLDKIYRVPVEHCGIKEGILRVEPTKGGPKTTIRWAADYEI